MLSYQQRPTKYTRRSPFSSLDLSQPADILSTDPPGYSFPNKIPFLPHANDMSINHPSPAVSRYAQLVAAKLNGGPPPASSYPPDNSTFDPYGSGQVFTSTDNGGHLAFDASPDGFPVNMSHSSSAIAWEQHLPAHPSASSSRQYYVADFAALDRDALTKFAVLDDESFGYSDNLQQAMNGQTVCNSNFLNVGLAAWRAAQADVAAELPAPATASPTSSTVFAQPSAVRLAYERQRQLEAGLYQRPILADDWDINPGAGAAVAAQGGGPIKPSARSKHFADSITLQVTGWQGTSSTAGPSSCDQQQSIYATETPHPHPDGVADFVGFEQDISRALQAHSTGVLPAQSRGGRIPVTSEKRSAQDQWELGTARGVKSRRTDPGPVPSPNFASHSAAKLSSRPFVIDSSLRQPDTHPHQPLVASHDAYADPSAFSSARPGPTSSTPYNSCPVLPDAFSDSSHPPSHSDGAEPPLPHLQPPPMAEQLSSSSSMSTSPSSTTVSPSDIPIALYPTINTVNDASYAIVSKSQLSRYQLLINAKFSGGGDEFLASDEGFTAYSTGYENSDDLAYGYSTDLQNTYTIPYPSEPLSCSVSTFEQQPDTSIWPSGPENTYAFDAPPPTMPSTYSFETVHSNGDRPPTNQMPAPISSVTKLPFREKLALATKTSSALHPDWWSQQTASAEEPQQCPPQPQSQPRLMHSTIDDIIDPYSLLLGAEDASGSSQPSYQDLARTQTESDRERDQPASQRPYSVIPHSLITPSVLTANPLTGAHLLSSYYARPFAPAGTSTSNVHLDGASSSFPRNGDYVVASAPNEFPTETNDGSIWSSGIAPAYDVEGIISLPSSAWGSYNHPLSSPSHSSDVGSDKHSFDLEGKPIQQPDHHVAESSSGSAVPGETEKDRKKRERKEQKDAEKTEKKVAKEQAKLQKAVRAGRDGGQMPKRVPSLACHFCRGRKLK